MGEETGEVINEETGEVINEETGPAEQRRAQQEVSQNYITSKQEPSDRD